jgi:hypothetical protein
MKAWVVTSGSYSDTHIDGIFSTLEKAQAYVDARRVLHIDMNDVCEYAVDAITVALPEYVMVEMAMDNIKDTYIRPIYSDLKYPYEWNDFNTVGFKVRFNRDENVMLKSARDQFATWRAMREGLI